MVSLSISISSYSRNQMNTFQSLTRLWQSWLHQCAEPHGGEQNFHGYCLAPTSVPESISWEWVETRPSPSVGVPAGEWLCCTRSGRLMWPAKPLLSLCPDLFFSSAVWGVQHTEGIRQREQTEGWHHSTNRRCNRLQTDLQGNIRWYKDQYLPTDAMDSRLLNWGV